MYITLSITPSPVWRPPPPGCFSPLSSPIARRKPLSTRNLHTKVGLAALSLGMIFVGTCNEEVGSVLVQRLMESSDTELEQPMARLVSLGLGLLFIGKNEQADAMMEVR